MADPKDPYSWGPDRRPQHALPRTPTSRWIPDEDPQLAHHDPLPVKSTILDPSTDRSEWDRIWDPEVEENKYRDYLRDSRRMRGHDPNLTVTPDVPEPTAKMSLKEAAELPVYDEAVIINLDELPPNYIKLLRSPKIVRKLFSEQQRDLADYMREAVRSARWADIKPLNPGIVLRNWAEQNRLGRIAQAGMPGDVIDPTTEEAIAAALKASFGYPLGIVKGGIEEGIKTSAAAVGLGKYIDPSLEGPNPEAIKVIKHHEEMIAKRLGEPFMIQLEEDIAMNLIGFVDLGRLILGGGLKDEDWRGGPYGDFFKFFERGSEIGGLFANGILAINYVVLKDLLSGNVEKLTAQPLTTAMVFYPVLKALKKAGRATPGMKRAIEALDNGYDRIKKVSLETANQAAHVVLGYPVGKILAYKYGVPPDVAKVMGKTFMMQKGKQAAYAAVVLAHWLDKSWWHFDRKWEKVLREFQREEGSYKSLIVGRIEEFARAVDRGEVALKIDPDGTVRRTDGTPLTGEELAKELDDVLRQRDIPKERAAAYDEAAALQVAEALSDQLELSIRDAVARKNPEWSASQIYDETRSILEKYHAEEAVLSARPTGARSEESVFDLRREKEIIEKTQQEYLNDVTEWSTQVERSKAKPPKAFNPLLDEARTLDIHRKMTYLEAIPKILDDLDARIAAAKKETVVRPHPEITRTEARLREQHPDMNDAMIQEGAHIIRMKRAAIIEEFKRLPEDHPPLSSRSRERNLLVKELKELGDDGHPVRTAADNYPIEQVPHYNQLKDLSLDELISYEFAMRERLEMNQVNAIESIKAILDPSEEALAYMEYTDPANIRNLSLSFLDRFDVEEMAIKAELQGVKRLIEQHPDSAPTWLGNVEHAVPLPDELAPYDAILQREYVRYDGYTPGTDIPPTPGKYSFTIFNEEWGPPPGGKLSESTGHGSSFTVTEKAIAEFGDLPRAMHARMTTEKGHWGRVPEMSTEAVAKFVEDGGEVYVDPATIFYSERRPGWYAQKEKAAADASGATAAEAAEAAGESPVVTKARERKAELEKDPPVEPPERQLQPTYRWDLPMKEDPITRKIVYTDDHIKLIEDLANDPAKFQEHLQRIADKHAESIFDDLVNQGRDHVEAAELAAAMTEEALGNITPEQLAQIWYGETVPVGRVNTVFQDPFYQKMLDGVIEEIHQYFPEESWILNDVEPVMGAIRQVRTLKGAKITKSEVQTLFTSALRDTSTQLLRSKKLRLKIAKEIHKEYGVSVAEVNKLLENMGESHLMEQPFGYEVTLANGRSFNLFDALVKQVKHLDKLDPGTMNGIRAEVLRRIALRLGEEGSRKVFKKQMADEASRFAGTNSVQYTDAIFKAVLLRGEIPPNILKEYTPTQIANQLRSSKARYIKELMEATGMKAADAEAHVLTLASEIEKYKVPPTALGSVTPEGTTAVHKVFSDSMDWHLKSLNTLNFMDTWVHRLTNFMKVNLTARNIPTHIHNFVANAGHTGLRRGMTPLGVLNSLRKTGKLWESYKNGTLREINPEMYHMLREVESSGLLDTTRIEAEFGPRGLKGRLAKGRKPMQEAYRWGDNIFKLDETIVQLTDLRAQLNRLKPGEWAKVRTSKAKADAVFLEMLPDGGFKIRGGTKLSEAQLNKILVKASMEKALDIFFDYTEMSNFGKLLRAAPLMGVMSPFFSWYWKSLDIPFVKEGLVTKLVQSNDVILATNSTAINMQLAKAHAALAARRAVVLSGIRGTLSRMSDDDRRKFFKRIGKDVGIILMENLEDPRYVSYQNWEAINFATSGLKLMRLGYEAYAKTLDPEDIFPRLEDGSLDVELKSIPEAERKDLRKLQKIFANSAGGHLADITDFLEVVGMSGTPLLDFLITVEQAVQREAPIGLGEAYSRFGKALVGGVAHSASMVALGVLDPASTWGTRQFALSDDRREQEDATKWVVRTLFKWGWRQKRVAKARKKYMADFTRAMTNALDTPIDRRRKNLLKLGFKDEAAALKNKQRWINQIIKEEIKKMNRQDKANRNKYLEN